MTMIRTAKVNIYIYILYIMCIRIIKHIKYKFNYTHIYVQYSFAQYFRYSVTCAIFVMIGTRGQRLKMIQPRIILYAQGHLRKIIFKLVHMNQRARKDQESNLPYTPASGFKVSTFYGNDHLLFRERIFIEFLTMYFMISLDC